MNRAPAYHKRALIALGVVALGLSTRCLGGDENPGLTMTPIELADAKRVTQTCEEVIKAFPPGDRWRQWQIDRDNLLAAVRELPGLMRREGSPVREGFAWNVDEPITDDTFDIQQRRGFLAPHRPGIVPSATILDLRAQSIDLVQEGMSPEDVAQILGRPDDRFEQNTAATGYQKTVFYALPGDRMAFLWFDSDDRLSYKYPNRSAPVRIETGHSPSRDPRPGPAIATPSVAAPTPSPIATTPATMPSLPGVATPPVAVPDPSEIRIGDTVVVRARSSLRTWRSTVRLQTDLRLRVVDVRGDQIGCLLHYADGDEAVGWVDKSFAAKPRQDGTNVDLRPAAQPRGNEQLQPVGYTTRTPQAVVRPQPSAYGASIITFDNQSGDPAVVRLVGPTRDEVYVPNGGQSSIRRVAPGEYVIFVRFGTAGAYRYTRGDPFHVQEYGANHSSITITLHTVPTGNYNYHEGSEAEFNQ